MEKQTLQESMDSLTWRLVEFRSVALALRNLAIEYVDHPSSHCLRDLRQAVTEFDKWY